MSWMDSWSRPHKSQSTPPPLYLTSSTPIPYCHTCGRVISQRRTNASQQVKYCSQRCRNSKPGPLDRKIEDVFVALLEGRSEEDVRAKLRDSEVGAGEKNGPGKDGDGEHLKTGKGKKTSKTKAKGDPRLTIECSTVEALVFPRELDPSKVYGRRKNRAARGVIEKPEDWRSVDMVDDPVPPAVPPPPAPDSVASTSTCDADTTASEDDEEVGGISIASPVPLPDQIPHGYGYGGGKVRPPQELNDVNGGVGGEKGWAERIEETDDMKAKRREGQRKADEREMVRRAARRGVAFGFVGAGEEDGERRKCEAVMKGVVVEASFAKGEWGVRWREQV